MFHAKTIPAIEEALKTGEVQSFEYRLAEEDIEAIYENRIVATSPDSVLSLVRDVTEQRLAALHRKRSEERFAKAFQTNPAALAITSMEKGVFIDVNESWLKLMEYAREEVIGRTALELSIYDEPEDRVSLLDELQKEGRIRERPITRISKSGKTQYGIMSLEIIDLDGADHVLAMIYDVTDQKRAEAALEGSEERFARAFHANPVALVISTLDDATLVDVNEAFLRFFGFKREEVIGRTAFELNLYEGPEQREELMQQLRTEGRIVRQSITHMTPDGELQIGLSSWELIELNGREHVLTMTFDITEQTRVESALRESEQRFRTLYDISRATSETVSVRDLLAVVRERLADLLDTKNFFVALYNEATGLYTFPYWVDEYDSAPEDWQPQSMTGSLTDYVRRTGEPLRVDGPQHNELIEAGEAEMIGAYSKIWLGVPLRTSAGVIGVMVVQNYEDATVYDDARLDLLAYIAENIAWVVESKISEAEVRSLNRSLERRIAEQTRDLQVAADVSHHVSQLLEQDEMLQSIAQLTKDSFDLYHVSVFVYNEETGMLGVAASSGGDSEGILNSRPQFPLTLSQGLVVYAGRNRQPVVENRVRESDLYLASSFLPEAKAALVVPMIVGGRLVGVLNLEASAEDFFTSDHERVLTSLAQQLAVAIQNATRFEQLHQLNEELQTLDRLKSDFLASMSHELRTPLNAVINFNQFVSTALYGPVSPKQVDALDKSTNSARHLLALINDVLDMSKIESGQFELSSETDINLYEELKIVTDITSPLLTDKPVELIETYEQDLPPITGDRRRIRQILLNLTSNAAKFTKEGTVEFRVWTEDGQVVFAVADTGPGIPESDRDVIFEVFGQGSGRDRRTVATGTGLGLPISRRLAEAHGGRLWMESKVGEGSTFYVSLPIKPEQEEVETPILAS